MPRWEKVGRVIVDSGCIVITDTDNGRAVNRARQRRLSSYSKWMLQAMRFYVAHGRPAKDSEVERSEDVTEMRSGLLVSGFGGDGTYPVYAQRNSKGVIRAVMIDLNDTA